MCRPRLDVACTIVSSVDKIYKSQVSAETNNTAAAEREFNAELRVESAIRSEPERTCKYLP